MSVDLSHSDHAVLVLRSAENLRRGGELLDVRLRCLDGALLAHKLVLAANSHHFRHTLKVRVVFTVHQ